MKADVLLVVTTDVERRALLTAAATMVRHMVLPQPVHGHDRTYHDLGLVGGARTLVVQAEMGSGTVGGSLITTAMAIQEVRPTTILMVGIAFGVDPEKQPIGHILVSRQIQQYEIQRVGTHADGTASIVARGDRATAPPLVLSRLRAVSTYFGHVPVEFGLLLSGEKVVDNHDFRQELRAREPDAIGGEMEGGGLYVAATEKHLGWCVVKAVCDYADGRKRENKADRQALAAKNAAEFVLAALLQGGFAGASEFDAGPR